MNINQSTKWENNFFCSLVVKINGNYLKNVLKQTEEICLEAVKKDGCAIQYVEKQTEKICLQAIKQNSYALKYVKKILSIKKCV
jgi:hypothetical protein